MLVAAIIGIALTYRQIAESHKTQKASFFKDLYSTLYGDPDIRKIYYDIEYNKFIYDRAFCHSENERLMDHLLSFADLVCDLYAQGIITDHEMGFLKYEFSRIYKNENVRGYLDFLENFYPKTGADVQPFRSFRSYCERDLIMNDKNVDEK